MRGRILFEGLKPLLRACSVLLKVVPRGIRGLFMAMLRYLPGVIGVGCRYVLIRSMAAECGDNVAIYDSVFLRNMSQLRLGSNISVHPLCYLDALGGTTIGSDTSIAHNVTIVSFEHDWEQSQVAIKDAALIPKPIFIGKGVWIGAGARILGGVVVGDGAVVGAGAVVTRSVKPNCVVAGVPARVISQRKAARSDVCES